MIAECFVDKPLAVRENSDDTGLSAIEDVREHTFLAVAVANDGDGAVRDGGGEGAVESAAHGFAEGDAVAGGCLRSE